MKQLYIIVVLLSFPPLHAETCNQATLPGAIESLLESEKKILPKLHADSAQKDMKNFCHRNMMLRYLNVKNKAPKGCETWSISKLEELVNSVADNDNNMDAWDAGMIPTEKYTRKSIDLSFNDHFNSNPLLKPLNIEDVKKILNNNVKVDQLRFNTRKLMLQTMNMQSNYKANRRVDAFYTTFLCGEISITKAISCSDSIEKIKAINTPKSIGVQNEGTKFTNIPLWEEILLNTKYDEGLRLAGLKLVERIEGKVSGPDNIFSDLKESFEKSGMSKAQAEDASFKTMGLISNGANNTGARISQLNVGAPSDAKGIALTLIGSSLQYLDYIKAKKGEPLYSLPENLQSKCLNFKYHHFWMSAYTARSLVKDYAKDPKAAAMATFTAHKGYHILRDLGRPLGKGASSVGVLSRPAYDPVHQIVRTDLAFASAGSYFGAEGTKKSVKANLDSSIVALLDRSKVTEQLDKYELQTKGDYSKYRIWKDIFTPNTAFETYYP